MISLNFNQTTSFSIDSLPEQWRKYASVQRVINKLTGTILYRVTIDVAAEDSSYRYRALMQKPQLVLKFSLPFFFEFPVETWCDFQNQRFILTNPENLKKQGENNIEYSMTLGTNEDFMSVWKLRNSVDNRLKFSMCAKPHEFIEEIVKNLNKKDTSIVWQVGECIESTEKTVEFNHAYIDAGLSDVCNVFETEYEVEYIGTSVAKLHLRKVEYFKDSPVALSYGRGNGFVPGVGRSSEAGGEPVKRMYIQGTDRNIDRSKYGSPELLLPKNQTLEYEGRTYRSSADGTYIERTDKVSTAIKEDSLDCSEIYPSRVGTVTAVAVPKPEKNYYDIIDSTIPSTLNFNNYLIAGENMTIIFQSGMLAGKEFDVKYKHDERKFELVPQEIDGVTMPNETYRPNADAAAPDTYAVFGCMLPDDYICNNTEKTGASWDMFREAAKALYECEDQKFTFSGQLQALWAKRNWLAVGGHLVVGGYVLFTDNQFAPDGVKIRIVGIKDYINKPYAPTIELSNSVSGASVTSQLRQIENTEVVIDDTKRGIIEFTKRRFRDAKETIEMLEDAMLDNFTNSISPVAVQTMALLVGDESLQYQFIGIDSKGNQAVRADVIGYNQEKKQLSFVTPSAGMDICLKHLTLGINTISSQHGESEYKIWRMKPYTSPVLADGSKRYYLYAKCPTDTSQFGELVLSEKAIKMEQVANCYHFLVGVLNTENNGERSFATLYGFTEVLPGRITTDRIVSGDGESFLDLVSNAFKLGDVLDFNNEEPGTLILNNAKIKNALKVLGEALIAGFYFSDERIRSTMMSGNDYALLLDGKRGRIKLVSTSTGGDYSLDSGAASTIDIDSSRGVVETRNNNGVAYMSASGIFCNNPKTNALPVSSGYTHYGAIVGLGFGDNVNNEWFFEKDATIVAGVYGRADNSGNAPAFGGYFQDLCAAGLIYRQKYITDSAATTAVHLGSTITQVVGLTNTGKTGVVYLPTDGLEGKVIYAKQIGAGAMRFYPKSGQKIFDDTSQNDYYDVPNGYECKFTFSVYNLNGERVEVWLVSRWKF